MQVKNRRDFYAGIMFMLFGIIFVGLSQLYQIGTASKMGPGYFPTILGGLLFILGLIVFVGAFGKNAETLSVEKFQFDISLYLLGGVALFAVALGPLGFVLAIALLILVSSKASHEFSIKDTAISIVVLLISSYLVFILGLQLQMPVFPKIFS